MSDASDAVGEHTLPDGTSGGPNDSAPDAVLPDGGLPPEHAWLADASIWKAVPGTQYLYPHCSVFEADPTKLQFPALGWAPCGAGCQVADVVQGYGERAAFPVVASTVRDGASARAYLVLQHGVETELFWYKVLRVLDLEAATIGAIQLVTPKGGKWSHCNFGNGRESALANSMSGSPTPTVEGTSREMHVFTGVSGAWSWSQPARLRSELPSGLIEIDLSETITPTILKVGKGSVSALTDVSKNIWTTLEAPSSSHHGAGEGDLAVWTDYPTGTTERVRGWSTDGKGVRTIVDPAPFDTCNVVTTPTHLVGFVADSGSCDGGPPGITSARLWRTSRAYDSSGVSLTFSPPLPGTPFSLSAGHALKAWGDYAVAQLWELDSIGAQVGLYFLVVQLSTWKSWRIDPRANNGIHGDGWTITDDAFYFGENAGTFQEPQYVRRMVRVPMTELSSFAQALD